MDESYPPAGKPTAVSKQVRQQEKKPAMRAGKDMAFDDETAAEIFNSEMKEMKKLK